MLSKQKASQSNVSFYLSILLFTALTVALFVFSATATYAGSTLTWDNGGTDSEWATANNWSPNTAPTSGSKVVFNSTTVANADINNSTTIDELQMKSGYTGTITQNSAGLTTNSTTITGGTFDANNAIADFLGGLNLDGSGATFLAGTKSHNYEGDLVISAGTFKQQTSSVVLDTPYNWEQSGGEFIGSDVNEAITVFNLTQTGGTITSTKGTLSADGIDLSSGTFNHNNGSVQLGGLGLLANTNTIKAATGNLNNLSVFNNVKLESDLTLEGYMNFVGNGNTVDFGNYDMQVQGDWELGNESFNLKQGSGKVIFAGSDNQHITSNSSSFETIKIDRASSTSKLFLDQDLRVTEDLLHFEGEITDNGNNIRVKSDWFTNSSTATSLDLDGTVFFTGNDTQDIVSQGNKFNNITLNNQSSSKKLNLFDELTVTNTLEVKNGTFDANGNTTTVKGPTKLTGSGASYLADDKPQYLEGGLEISKGTFKQESASVLTEGADGGNDYSDFIQTGGEFIGASGSPDFAIKDFKLTGGTNTLNSGQKWVFGDINITGGTLNSSNSHVAQKSSVSNQLSITSSGRSFDRLRLDGSGSMTVNLNDTLTVNQMDLENNVILDSNDNDIKVAADWNPSNDSYTFNPGAATVFFNGSGPQEIFSKGENFYKINIKTISSSDFVRPQDELVASSTLTIERGTFDAADNTTTYNGEVTINSSSATYKAGNKPQNFNSGLTLQGGTYNGETAPTNISGGRLTLSGGTVTSTNTNTLSISNQALVETYSNGKFKHLFPAEILTASSNDPSSTKAATFNYTSTIGTDGNQSGVQFPQGTKLSTANGSTQNFNKLMGSNQVSSTPNSLNVKGSLQVGLHGQSLTTNQNATVQIFVGNSENGNTLSIFKKVGSNNWKDTGKDCTVNNGMCQFTTQSFSQFTAATEDTSNNTTDDDDDDDGGGGGGSAFAASGSTGPNVQSGKSAVLINNGDNSTNNRNVTLTFNVNNVDKVAVSNSNNFTGASFNSYPSNDKMNYTLAAGQGTKTVYVRFAGNGKTLDSKDSIKLTTSEGTAADGGSTTQCPLTPKQPFTTNQTQAVYYITTDCTKRAFTKPRVYFTYFDSWQDVNQTDPSTLNGIKDDQLGFMPWGPNKNIKAGQLFKSVTNPKVYVQQANGNKCWIKNEQVFKALNYSFNNVWDVHSSYIQQTPICNSPIDYTDHHPNYTLIKYPNSNNVYLLEPNNGQQVKRLIKNMNVFNKLNLSRKDIITIDQSEQYPTGKPLTMSSSL